MSDLQALLMKTFVVSGWLTALWLMKVKSKHIKATCNDFFHPQSVHHSGHPQSVHHSGQALSVNAAPPHMRPQTIAPNAQEPQVGTCSYSMNISKDRARLLASHFHAFEHLAIITLHTVAITPGPVISLQISTLRSLTARRRWTVTEDVHQHLSVVLVRFVPVRSY